MAWITIIAEPGAKATLEDAYPDLSLHEEPTEQLGQSMLTVVGAHSRVVVFLAEQVAPADDLGLAFLISEVQLADEAMDEHNAAASAVGL